MKGESRIGRGRLRKLVIDLSIVAGVGLLLALLGPFGTYDASLAWRLLYWIPLSMAGYFCYVPITDAVLRGGDTLELPRWPLWGGAMLVASVPMTGVVMLVGLPGQVTVSSADTVLRIYGHVLVIGAFVSLLFQLIDANAGASSLRDVRKAAVAEPASRFLGRIPPALGGDLLALEMEDHYVRAHTALGSTLVLMRLRDAITEVEEIEGMQVHRSWWVARHAVADVRREGRNLRLVLDNGLEAPVARANVQVLKAAGWI